MGDVEEKNLFSSFFTCLSLKGQGVWILSQFASAEGEETPWTISKTDTGIIKVDKHINALIYTLG